MTIASMTGFARSDGQVAGRGWSWELRSVNARGLETRTRLATGYEWLEGLVRQRLLAALQRGSVMATLTVTTATGQGAVRINRAVLAEMLALAAELGERLPTARPASIDGLLSLRGVVESADAPPAGDEREAVEGALLAGLDEALANLKKARASEGARLAQVLAGHLARLAALAEEAVGVAATQPAALLARLQEQLATLLAGSSVVAPERLAQEVALLAAKADVNEELDRIAAHLQAAEDLMARAGPIGRRFDFLCQEFNREANTLCAKSADVALTRVGLDMKATIDQLREQVQNIE